MLIKKLSPNDNSKNQVYLGGEEYLHYLPFESSELERLESKKSSKAKFIFKNKLNFAWITEKGKLHAPNAKVIFYPQYPESRFSGFLKGCKGAPSNLIGSERLNNRFLILSFNRKGESFGHVGLIKSNFSSLMKKLFSDYEETAFFETTINTLLAEKERPPANLEASIKEIKAAINKVSRKGWIKSKKFNKEGQVIGYKGPNAGGVTLETELGIKANSDAKPDYLGWELKQHKGKGAVTLFTPEPDAGFYNKQGIAEFIKEYGYPDNNGVKDRYNFGGIYRATSRQFHEKTNLRLVLIGFRDGDFTSQRGFIGLLNIEGDIVAKWTFPKLLVHWQRKHARTCFVKSERKIEDEAYFYRYFPELELGIESSFMLFLKNLEEGIIYLDPAAKLFKENGKWKTKARSQYRIKDKDLPKLYKKYLTINANS